MIDVIDLIPSKDMRQALRESDREFTDMEKATILAHVPLERARRIELLQELANETEDELVREQVQYSLDDEQRLIDKLRDESEGCIYGVLLYEEDDVPRRDDEVDAYFDEFPLAYEFGVSRNVPFKVSKWRINQSVPEPDVDSWRCDGFSGSLTYDEHGELTSTHVWNERDESAQWFPNIMMGKWKNYLFFEDRWIDLPNLYQCGDIVRLVGLEPASYVTPAYDWAVVSVDHDSWEEMRARTQKWQQGAEAGAEQVEGGLFGDYSDMQILLEFPCDDGTFAHDHINPMFIERVEAEPEDADEAELRQMATWAARGECGLEHISRVLKKRILAAQGKGE